MQVVNHLIAGMPFVRSPNISGLMRPTGAIMHYTAGYTAKSAINVLTDSKAKVSAHFVIDRDGSATQLVPLNRVAWHAGPSQWNGKAGCNNFTIGFEFVNPGYFKLDARGEIIDAYDHTLSAKEAAQFDLSVRAPDKRIGGGTYIWPGYTPAQIATGKEILAAVHRTYGLSFVAGHEDIDTRKWKTDPGDAFPMGEFKAIVHGGALVPDRSDGMNRAGTKMLVGTAKLNVRLMPEAGATVIAQIDGGTEVSVIRDLGAWSEVEIKPGQTGFVADQYLKKVA